VFSFITALSPAAFIECPVNASFLRDKAAVLGAVINERPPHYAVEFRTFLNMDWSAGNRLTPF